MVSAEGIPTLPGAELNAHTEPGTAVPEEYLAAAFAIVARRHIDGVHVIVHDGRLAFRAQAAANTCHAVRTHTVCRRIASCAS